MKLELQKIRDEFKISESDCGSSRVQGEGCTKFVLIYVCFSLGKSTYGRYIIFYNSISSSYFHILFIIFYSGSTHCKNQTSVISFAQKGTPLCRILISFSFKSFTVNDIILE